MRLRTSVSIQERLESLGFGLYLGEIESEGMRSTGWSGTAPIIMSENKSAQCCHIPWWGFPMFTRMIVGQRVSFLNPLFPLKTENRLDASSTLFYLSWGQDLEMKLPFPSGFLLPWQCEAHIPEKTVPACLGNILIICVCCF